MGLGVSTWVIVLIKDFNSAKQRLQPALGPKARRALARRNAQLAVRECVHRYFMGWHRQASRQPVGIRRAGRQIMDGNAGHGDGPPVTGGLPSIW